MPELPEVETVKRGLEKLIIGLQVDSVECDNPKSFPNSPQDVEQFMIGAKISGVRRRAKVLIIDLDTKYSLVVHLKMTGQVVFRGEQNFGAGHPNDSLVGSLPDKSTRVIIELKGSSLFFNDRRKFGWMRLISTQLLDNTLKGAVVDASARRNRVAERPVQDGTGSEQRRGNEAIAQSTVPVVDFMKKVGPEPLENTFTDKVFIERVRKRSNTSIKAAILDQTVLAGVGNIYADESLWGAKIHPATQVKNLTDTQLKKLKNEIVYVLDLSIKKGGSTDKNYVDAEGKKGSYLQFARVFRREGQACPVHPSENIVKIRVAGRGTHLCSKCQKAP